MTDKDIARAGYKALLKAQAKTKAELLAMASALESGIDETIITQLSTDGTGTSAQMSSLSKTDRLAVIMEIYSEGNGARSLGTIASFSSFSSMI